MTYRSVLFNLPDGQQALVQESEETGEVTVSLRPNTYCSWGPPTHAIYDSATGGTVVVGHARV